MTKIYDVIHLNGQSYMVDKETIIKENEIGTDGFHIEFFRLRWQEKDWSKIIASTNEKLGLPLLPAFEEDIYEMAKNACIKENKELEGTGKFIPSVKYIYAWVEGYKAAKAKRYTEEDMIEALSHIANEMRENGMGACSTARHKAKLFWADYKQSLNPLPTKVEVEMIEIMGCADDNEPFPTGDYLPKTVNNIIVVKRWIL